MKKVLIENQAHFFSVTNINIFGSGHHRKKYNIIHCVGTASSSNITGNPSRTVPASPSKTQANFLSHRVRLAGVFPSGHLLLLLPRLALQARTVARVSSLLSSLPILASSFPSAACFLFHQLCHFGKEKQTCEDVKLWRLLGCL